MANAKTPYSVLVMDKDLNIQKNYRDFGVYRTSQIKKIFDLVGLKDKRLLTCHTSTVLNSNVLYDFKKKFMIPKKLSYKDLIEIAPYEYSWYNAWLQKSKIIDILNVESFIKIFHTRMDYIIFRVNLISQANIAEKYVGIILNSNWKPKPAPSNYEDPSLKHKLINKLIRLIG
jgi:hypothetical protein